MSRTTNNYLAASKQSDAQAAREAAESGMSRVLSALNPFSKHTTDPYLSFLLASRWQPDTGITYTTGVSGSTEVVRSGWRLTTLPQSTVRSLLSQCGLADRGQHPSQLPPASQQGYRDILSGAIGPAGAQTGTQLRYMVVDYVPPVRPESSVPWPAECEDFTSLAGGTAQISIQGRVIRNGVEAARYTLTRNIDVQGWPLPSMPASWVTARIFPAAPVGLRIAGTAGNLERTTLGSFTNFATDLTPVFSVESLPQCLNLCPNGPPYNMLDSSKPGVETRVNPTSDVIPANQSDLPRYPFDTDIPPSGTTPRQINESRSNYPYISAGSTTLYPECRRSETADTNRPREDRPNEIDCWIESIGVAKVDTANYNGTSGLITVTLPRFDDVNPGTTRIKLTQISPQSGVWSGLVASSSSSGTTQTITFTPTSPPNNNSISSCSPSTCYVSPESAVSLSINTEDRPVNLIIRGDVGGAAAADYVTLKHLVKASPPQNFVHSIAGVNVRTQWNRLRVFGRKDKSGACASNLEQWFYINPASDPNNKDNGDASLGGAFLWLPRGHLYYGTTNQVYPRQLLTVWWLCNLDVNGLTTSMDRMALLTPLGGNPDVVGGLLPGGFFSSAGVFTPDLRFPVYPSLQRIRSAY
ncbi:MAG: hypothetical protein VKO39_06090 [Cyanobacteriota bacterium]|nr:hypothetical protein [Cyanobacteriota bacterium]